MSYFLRLQRENVIENSSTKSEPIPISNINLFSSPDRLVVQNQIQTENQNTVKNAIHSQGDTSLDILIISPPITGIIEDNRPILKIENEIESGKCLTASLYKEDNRMNSMQLIEYTDKHRADRSEEGSISSKDNRVLESREKAES